MNVLYTSGSYLLPTKSLTFDKKVLWELRPDLGESTMEASHSGIQGFSGDHPLNLNATESVSTRSHCSLKRTSQGWDESVKCSLSSTIK